MKRLLILLILLFNILFAQEKECLLCLENVSKEQELLCKEKFQCPGPDHSDIMHKSCYETHKKSIRKCPMCRAAKKPICYPLPIISSMRISTGVNQNNIAQLFSDDNSTLLRALMRGINPNIANQQGETPLHRAVKKLSSDNVHSLLYYRADPNIKNRDGNTPLHLLRFAREENSGCFCLSLTSLLFATEGEKIAKELINNGADINQKNNVNESIKDLALHKIFPGDINNIILDSIYRDREYVDRIDYHHPIMYHGVLI